MNVSSVDFAVVPEPCINIEIEPIEPGVDFLWAPGFEAGEETQFQDAAGRVQPTKKLLRNRFEIVRRLGRGGFGTTYLANDLADVSQPMPCVIKQLTYKLPPSPKGTHALPNQSPNQRMALDPAKAAFAQERMKRRFHREANMMARLGRHAQLPCLLEHFNDGDQFYLVQEHVPGLTLSQEMSRRAPYSEAEVRQFLWEMLPIVGYIHQQNLLHLDIKPANIIRRSSDNALVLIDFGAVRRYPSEGVLNVHDRCSTGTVGFSPMEQLEGKPTYASDIYSLGVTCLYMLTKVSPLDLATAERGQNLRWQESVKLTPHFGRILNKMLQSDVKRRFQTVDELTRILQSEAFYEEFKTYLTTEPLLAQRAVKPSACLLPSAVEKIDGTPAQRQAEAIRHWQQRRRQFRTFKPS
jgi:serine/threonine protein kinase